MFEFRKIFFVEKTKLGIGELRVGMFVCELDRPWLETPFLFQGFYIEEEKDIDIIGRYCKYVYVDVERAKLLRQPNLAINCQPNFRKPNFKNRQGKKTKPLDKELDCAVDTQKRTSALIKTFVEEVKFGRPVDIQVAKSAVSNCVASIMRNPDALLLVTQIRDKDDYTSQHSFNVCVYSITMGRCAGMSIRELENLGLCGLLHDMGKVAIPGEILNKKGTFSAEEAAVMKTHTVLGRDILMSSRNIFDGTVDAAYGHHESLDGSGYPRGLVAHQISQNVKIISIVDKYDAIVSDRIYQKGKTHLETIGILNKMAINGQLDNKLTMGFISAMSVYPTGCIVELSSGEVGIVIEVNPKNRLKPQIMVVRDTGKNPMTPKFIDLTEIGSAPNGQLCVITHMHRPGDFGIEPLDFRDLFAPPLAAFSSAARWQPSTNNAQICYGFGFSA